MTIEAELIAFDNLPQKLRTILNYTPDMIDPRFILGMYKQRGLRDTIDYLDGIGAITNGGHMSNEIHDR